MRVTYSETSGSYDALLNRPYVKEVMAELARRQARPDLYHPKSGRRLKGADTWKPGPHRTTPEYREHVRCIISAANPKTKAPTVKDVKEEWKHVTSRAVVQIKRMMDDGLTCPRIAMMLNAAGSSNRGRRWTARSVSRACPVYLGEKRKEVESMIRRMSADGIHPSKIADALNREDLRNQYGGRWKTEAVRCRQKRYGVAADGRSTRQRKSIKGARTRIKALRDMGLSSRKVAKQLNAEGFKTAMGRSWTKESVLRAVSFSRHQNGMSSSGSDAT